MHRRHPARRIDQLHPLRQHLDFRTPDLPVERGELAVHVGHAHVIEIDERQSPHSAPRKRLHRPRAHTAHTYDRHMRDAQALKRRCAQQTAHPAKTILIIRFHVVALLPCSTFGDKRLQRLARDRIPRRATRTPDLDLLVFTE